MDIDKIIALIPELLLNFIPGFISIRIKEIYGCQNKHDEFGYTIYSILYSFVILLVYRIFTAFVGVVKLPLTAFLAKETVKCCACLLLAVVLGILLAKLPQSKPGSWFGRKINELTSPEGTVWEKAMKNPNGAWARVYLNNGMVYYGELIDYTINPDDPVKVVMLYNYELKVRIEEKDSNKSGHRLLYVGLPKTSKETDKVLIKRDDIVSIEIMPTVVEGKDASISG